MTRGVDRFFRWARKFLTPPSDSFLPTEVLDAAGAGDMLIYRLRRWPHLPSASMNTDVSRTLSVMSTRPVNRRWILNNSSLQEHEVDSMLQCLVEQDAVEVTDAAKYQAHASAA
jgi:hypothetical protein